MRFVSKLAVFAMLTAFSAGYGEVVDSITMAKGTEGELKNPVNETNEFSPTDTIHAVVRLDSAPEHTKVGASWYVVDVGDAAEPNSLIESADLTTEGTRNVDFFLAPSKPFPKGSYKVDISVNGNVEGSKEYSVK